MTSERPLAGVLLMILAMQVVPMTDAIAKHLAADLDVLQVAWARSAFQVLWILPLVFFGMRGGARIGGLPAAKSWRAFSGHVLRGALWAGATMFYFAAISDNPLPDALAVLFIAPLVVAAAAPVLLGESFDARRALVVTVGFAGVLIVLRPAAAEFKPSILFALAAGACYGGYLMATRAALRGGGNRRGRPAQVAFYAMLAAAALSTPFALAVWKAPDAAQWGWMALMGMISAFGHYLIAKACEYASASLVAPFHYTEIIGACAVSYLVFGDVPDGVGWLGIALIIGAGVYVSLREYRRDRAVSLAPPP